VFLQTIGWPTPSTTSILIRPRAGRRCFPACPVRSSDWLHRNRAPRRCRSGEPSWPTVAPGYLSWARAALAGQPRHVRRRLADWRVPVRHPAPGRVRRDRPRRSHYATFGHHYDRDNPRVRARAGRPRYGGTELLVTLGNFTLRRHAARAGRRPHARARSQPGSATAAAMTSIFTEYRSVMNYAYRDGRSDPGRRARRGSTAGPIPSWMRHPRRRTPLPTARLTRPVASAPPRAVPAGHPRTPTAPQPSGSASCGDMAAFDDWEASVKVGDRDAHGCLR
jgi:hypothetical protein